MTHLLPAKSLLRIDFENTRMKDPENTKCENKTDEVPFKLQKTEKNPKRSLSKSKSKLKKRTACGVFIVYK